MTREALFRLTPRIRARRLQSSMTHDLLSCWSSGVFLMEMLASRVDARFKRPIYFGGRQNTDRRIIALRSDRVDAGISPAALD